MQVQNIIQLWELLLAYHRSSVTKVHSTDEFGEFFKLGDVGAKYFKMALSIQALLQNNISSNGKG